MEYRSLGRTGVMISPIGLGSDNFGDATSAKDAEEIINLSLDAGINLIDTGDVYCEGESERIIGKTLKNNQKREQVIIATKVDHGRRRIGVSLDTFKPEYGPNDHGHSRLNIIRACEASLKRLNTDYIDIYQLHRHSPNIPIDETLRALDDLVTQGKIRYIGSSTHPAWAVMEAIMVSESMNFVRLSTEQPPYNLLDRRIENELIPLAKKYGIGLITWGPLAMGILAGRYTSLSNYPKTSTAARRGGFYAKRISGKGIDVGKEFLKISKNVGISAAQLALLWCKDQPGITAPLIGVRTNTHLEALLPVLEMTLDNDTRKACDQLVPPGSFVADFHNTSYWNKAKVLE